MTATATLAGPSASTAMQATSAESIPPERPRITRWKPFLRDVVAQARDQRRVDLGARVEQRRERAAGAVGLGGDKGQRQPRERRHVWRVTGGCAMARVAQPVRVRRCRVDRRDEQLLLELPCARDHLALVVDHERVAVEDELVLAADERAEGDRADVVARALDEHPLALEPLARVVRRGGDVHEHGRAGARLVGGRRPRLPDVLADRQPDLHVAELDQRAAGAGLEVALLVEDSVVRQPQLAVDRLRISPSASTASAL